MFYKGAKACSVAKYRFSWFGTLFFYKGAKDNSCLFVCIPCFGTLYHRKGTKATNIYKKHQKWFETLYFLMGQKIIHIQIAKNRNYIIIGRVAVLPLTGKYCMGKRGGAASELSTVRKKPEYHADFVIWGFGTLCFYKGAKVARLTKPLTNSFGTLCFYKGAKDELYQKSLVRVLEPYVFAKMQRLIPVALMKAEVWNLMSLQRCKE